MSCEMRASSELLIEGVVRMKVKKLAERSRVILNNKGKRGLNENGPADDVNETQFESLFNQYV